MARFFIDRPIFAWVVSIMIMVLGTLAITQLPIAQYPNVAPPSISVTASYAGASAETLQDTVTSVSSLSADSLAASWAAAVRAAVASVIATKSATEMAAASRPRLLRVIRKIPPS